MCELETTDPDLWRYLRESFSIAKSNIPFTSIGSDHAMEQENKILKVSGGVTGLTQNQSALNRFCLTSLILASISEEFCNTQNITTEYRTYHYQLCGSTQDRIAENVTKLLKVMDDFEVAFDNDEFVFNVFSKAILDSSSATQLLNHATIGDELYQAFLKERFHGDISLWATMKKLKLKTFKTSSKTLKKKVGEKIVQLKEEKMLLSRFLITARKRPELDLEHCLGNFEFSVVPKALFTADGQPLLCTDKASVLHHIEDLEKKEDAPRSTIHQPIEAVMWL